MPNKISILSLGCPKNLVDSDNLIRRLINNGFSYCHAPEDADILLINTCGFIEDAKKESVEEIIKLVELKNSKRQSVKVSKRLIVFGCLAKRYRNELLKEIPEIDAIFGVGEEEKIIEHCKKLKGSNGLASGESPRRQSVKGHDRMQDTGCRIQDKKNHASCIMNHESFLLTPPSYAYLKIAEGCDKKCSYCIIPSIRGSYRSVAPESIMKEAERKIKAGVKELILVAQDTACYGKDINGYDITSLLKDLCSISGDFWIRLLYTYPASIKDYLLHVIAQEDKICKYLDIPLQHSEDRILRLMKRGGTRERYLNLIRKIRGIIPDIVLRTTFIVGFPSETEDEFHSLLDFIEDAQFDRLGAFKYSKEEGTPAAELEGHLPKSVKDGRLDMLMRHQSSISLGKNKELIRRQFKAIIDEVNNGIAIARLYSHAPEIDGVVIIEKAAEQQSSRAAAKDCRTAELLHFCTFELKSGDFVTVEITDAFDYDLKGIPIDRKRPSQNS